MKNDQVGNHFDFCEELALVLDECDSGLAYYKFWQHWEAGISLNSLLVSSNNLFSNRNDLRFEPYWWWYMVFRSKVTKIDKQLVKNWIFPRNSWYLVWAKSFIFTLFKTWINSAMVNFPVGILRKLQTWSLGRVLFSGSVAGFPRRFLKWESQFSRRFSLQPPFRVVGGW